jgi:hypothetical protein
MLLNDHSPDDMPALLRATAPRPGPAGPDCLDEETVAAVVDGILDPVQRSAATAHLSACARCRSAVAAVSRIMSDHAVAAEAAALDQRGPIRHWRLPLGLAAAAAIVLLVAWPRDVAQVDTTHRDPTAAPAPVPATPMGVVADARVLQWTAVAGADRYRVTLFDAAGRVRYETQLADTTAALPDSVVLVPGQPYLWKVEARTGWERWTASDLVEFRIGGAPR